jgi:hypothetical protein
MDVAKSMISSKMLLIAARITLVVRWAYKSPITDQLSTTPSRQVFHEGLKSWSCCADVNKPVLEFDQFMKIPVRAKTVHQTLLKGLSVCPRDALKENTLRRSLKQKPQSRSLVWTSGWQIQLRERSYIPQERHHTLDRTLLPLLLRGQLPRQS